MKHATIAIIISLLLLSNQAQAFDNPTDVVYINGHPVARTDVDIDTNIAPHYHPAMGGSVTPLDGSSPILDDGMSFPGLGLVSGLGLGSFLSSSGFSNSDQLAILALFSIGLTPADIFFNPTFQPLVRLLRILAFLNQFSLFLTMGIVAGPDFVPQPAQSVPPPGPTPEPSEAEQTGDTPQTDSPGPASPDTTPTSSTDNRAQAELKRLETKLESLKSQATTTRDQKDQLGTELGAITDVLGLSGNLVLELAERDRDNPDVEIGKKILLDTFTKGWARWGKLSKTTTQLESDIDDTKKEITQLKKAGMVISPLPGGGSIQTFLDGKEILILPHGAGKIEGSPNGTTTITGPGGAWRTTTLANGRSRTYLSNGTTITTFLASDPEAKGSTKVKVVKPDGSGWIQDAAGNILVEF